MRMTLVFTASNAILQKSRLIDPDYLDENADRFEIEIIGKDKFEPFDLGRKVRILVLH